MLIKLTICDADAHNKFDIQVDSSQRIQTTLRILNENIQECNSFDMIERVRLAKSGKMISVKKTYEEAGIYTGAVLRVDADGE